MELTRNQNSLQASDTDSLTRSALPSVLHEDHYWPAEPTSIEDTGLSEPMIESLMCQVLLASGTLSGRKIAEAIGLPFGIIDGQLGALRTRQIVAHARSAPLNDYYYSLTEAGQQRALNHQKRFTYTGHAPVPMSEYLLSVEAQANQYSPVEKDQLVEALADISFEKTWLDFLGPAVNSNGGIFLHGPPGNGKTTLAKCLTILRGESIWIPHAVIDDGMIIKLFDSAYHRPKKVEGESGLVNMQNYDRRWIRIERPTVVAGGELTLDNLEIRHDQRSNTCEAPLQLKSNCGSLLIDDFGRQRVSPAELLNRWIVPLENKIDFLTLPTGKKISVPFEQIVLFSTNLEPHELVDEAFLRRVPFKIEIRDPGPDEFMYLFQLACQSMGFPWRPDVIKQLITGYFKANGRPLRRCYPRDLLKQVKAYCTYRSEPLDLRIDYLRHACRNYFGSLGIEDNGTQQTASQNAAGRPVTQAAQLPANALPQPMPSIPVQQTAVVAAGAEQTTQSNSAAPTTTHPGEATQRVVPGGAVPAAQRAQQTQAVQRTQKVQQTQPVARPQQVASPQPAAPVQPQPTAQIPQAGSYTNPQKSTTTQSVNLNQQPANATANLQAQTAPVQQQGQTQQPAQPQTQTQTPTLSSVTQQLRAAAQAEILQPPSQQPPAQQYPS